MSRRRASYRPYTPIAVDPDDVYGTRTYRNPDRPIEMLLGAESVEQAERGLWRGIWVALGLEGAAIVLAMLALEAWRWLAS